MSADLAALLERVRKASAWNHDLDCAVIDAIYPEASDWVRANRDAWDVTHSIDAAVALVERAAPRLRYRKFEKFSDGWYAVLSESATSNPAWMCQQAESLPLAIIAALLSALDTGSGR